MLQGMIDSVKACLKEELRMDVITNNLANSSVCGFKKYRISFQDVLNQETGGNAAAPADSSPSNNGMVRTEIDFTQGDFRTTGNALDMAVHGEGFFKIQTSEGIQYTRKGNFSLDNQGFLVTQNGEKVMGQAGPIQIQGKHIEMNGQGTITADGEAVGTIDLASFEDPSKLTPSGQAMFANPSGEPEIDPPAITQVTQGAIELPNVQVAEEMVSMIHSMRAFQSYQKVIRVLDEVNQRAINEVSRIR
jgi:flagellar basal-body rod protein FlgG